MTSFHFRDYNRKIGRRHLITPLSGNLAITQRREAPANSLNSGALYFAGISYYSFPVLRGQRLETRLTQSPDVTTRVFNMAAFQGLSQIGQISLVIIAIFLFNLYIATASTIRGVALTSK